MADKKLAGMHVLMVIAPEQFRDEELFEPAAILKEAGAQVTVASTREGTASGMLGGSASADKDINNVQSKDYQAVVVVGGMGSPAHLWHNKTLHKLLSECAQQGKVVAGICLSGAALANAGVLSGKQATVWATDESLLALKDGKAHYVQQPVVQDGNVITADGPEAAAQFGQTIAAALQRQRTAV